MQAIAQQDSNGGFVPVTDQPDFEYAEQRVPSEDRITNLQTQISSNRFDGEIHIRVRDLVI